MVEFDGEGEEQHFGVGIAFNIIGRLVQLFNNGFLLLKTGDLIPKRLGQNPVHYQGR